jgi:hypothetical protein
MSQRLPASYAPNKSGHYTHKMSTKRVSSLKEENSPIFGCRNREGGGGGGGGFFVFFFC